MTKNLFILLLLFVMIAPIFSLVYGGPTYTFYDGNETTSFLTYGRQYSYEIQLRVREIELPPEYIMYNYSFSCIGSALPQPIIEQKYLQLVHTKSESGWEIYTNSGRELEFISNNDSIISCAIHGTGFSIASNYYPEDTGWYELPVYSAQEYETKKQLIEERVQFQQNSIQTQQNMFMGAIIALFAALLGASVPIFIKWLNRPKLIVTPIKNTDPFVQEGVDVYNINDHTSTYLNNSMWLSIGIKNIGRSTAKNCYVKLNAIINKKNNVEITPFYPSPLKWTIFNIKRINLATSEIHLVNVAYQKQNDKFLTPACIYSAELERKISKTLGPGEYIFKISVYADNANPQNFECTIKISTDYKKLKFAL